MKKLITLSKKDPLFHKYLWGRLQMEVALPIQSLNVNSENEQVTFEVHDKADIQKPSTFVILLHALKLKNLIFVLFPLYALLVKTITVRTLDFPDLAMLSGLAAVFLFLAVSMKNDVQDHISGLDRIHPHAGNRALKEGWMSAQELARMSTGFLILGVSLGIPAIIAFPELLVLVGSLTLFGIFALTSYSFGHKYRRISEWIVFFILGPLLSLGFQISLNGRVDMESVALGFVFGWLILFVQHLKNFEQLVVNSQAKFNSSIVTMGFEKARYFLMGWWLSFLLFFVMYHQTFAASFWTWFLGLVLFASSLPFMGSLLCLKSPLGSDLQKIIRQGRHLFLFALTLWILENVWYLIVKVSWN